jgi:hypothetical protein
MGKEIAIKSTGRKKPAIKSNPIRDYDTWVADNSSAFSLAAALKKANQNNSIGAGSPESTRADSIVAGSVRPTCTQRRKKKKKKLIVSVEVVKHVEEGEDSSELRSCRPFEPHIYT